MARYEWSDKETDTFVDAINAKNQTRTALFDMYDGHEWLEKADTETKKTAKFNSRITVLLRNKVQILPFPKKIRDNGETIDADRINKRAKFSQEELASINERMAKAKPK